jgi:hypothetical protein
MSTRRQFLTSLGAGMILGKLAASGLVAAVATPLTEAEEKQELLRKLISTKEGRELLAASMVQPIRINRQYNAEGRPFYNGEDGEVIFLDLPHDLQGSDPPDLLQRRALEVEGVAVVHQ